MDQRHSISPVNTTAVPEPAINRPGADSTVPTTMQSNQANQDNETQRPGTPPRPPYSPVTPVFAHLAPVQYPSTTNGTTQPIVPPTTSPSPTSQVPPTPPNPSSLPPRAPPTFAPEPPPPVPISESDNPDAIALRSAISILQLQKQQSLRDIQTLERMKEAAAKDPERFARELVDGKLARKEQGGFIDFSHEEEDRDGDTESPEGGSLRSSELGTLPAAQNIVRMPAINWAKYQVVGESLDKMHEEQLRRPSLGEPRRDEAPAPASATPAPAPLYLLASPYQPLVDKLENSTKAKGSNKGKKS
ncbi:hypothetical protein BDW60DRAFT_60196 [Aspergillus nidulans var. acristatus]